MTRGRNHSAGLAGLEDRPRSGRPGTVDEAEVVVRTLEGPPEKLGVTHWSSPLLAVELRLSNVAVTKVWRKRKIQPWRSETFKFSTDPELKAKVPSRPRRSSMTPASSRTAIRRRV
ncbi:hypothetical protein OOK36_51955 [Streptomyces sp. NBC_00365]|uniref:hypothetical protein n=1 Tax=Streptomyces sp. NBC_00365 TaxID=2975726 RepID=UPI002255DB0F|nr:hypothetical protein [Streptomyces sp. NBC_00365]MCX5097063.1 hypothetical protein [Streptomyces sp. NBC_00365]